MADNKLPLSVAKTVPRYNPFASLLEGLARGLSSFLATRYQLDQARAAGQREEEKLNLQRGQLAEAIRANKAGEARTAQVDALRAQMDANEIRHQRELLNAEERLARATKEGSDSLRNVASGTVKQALDLERLAAEQEAQGNGEAAASLRAQATNFMNLARTWDPSLQVPTTEQRRLEGFRNAGFNEEEIQVLSLLDQQPDLPIEDRMAIATRYPRLRAAVLPQGFLLSGEEVQKAAESQVKPTESGLSKAGGAVGGAIGTAFSKETARIPVVGIPATLYQGAKALVTAPFKQYPKSAEEIQSETLKRRREIQAENRRLAGGQ